MALDKQSQYIVDGTDNVYLASTQAGQATSTGLSTTQTGFTLTNPAGSGKNLVVLQANVACTTAPAGAATIVWAANVNPVAAAVTQTTPLTVRSAKLGESSSASGLAASAVTLPAAPVVVRAIGGPVAASSISPPYIRDDVNGALVVEEGCAVSINSLTTAISAVISVVWREVDAF
jgi:hypothetical protein